MSPSPSTSLQTVIALETSESPSPSISYPSSNVLSAIKLVVNEDARAVKLGRVRKVNSLTKLNPAISGLAVVPVIFISMKEVGMLFQESNDVCKAAWAWASVRTGSPSGLGIGSSVLFMLYFTGMLRTSHLMPITFAINWPGIGEGCLSVMSKPAIAPPARTAITFDRARQRQRPKLKIFFSMFFIFLSFGFSPQSDLLTAPGRSFPCSQMQLALRRSRIEHRCSILDPQSSCLWLIQWLRHDEREPDVEVLVLCPGRAAISGG